MSPDETYESADPAAYIPRIKQVQWDHYYMQVARTVQTRANCYGTEVGAVLVLHNRIVSTGYNGTPEGFPNCRDNGCERCLQREARDAGELDKVTDPLFLTEGKHLDVCICVHAEANALLSAARYGTRIADSTLYATWQPCFTCLKESIQAGVRRVVYLYPWSQAKTPVMRQQYELLAEHLRANDARNFEQLARQNDLIKNTGGHLREPNLDSELVAPDATAPEGSTTSTDAAAHRSPAPKRRGSAAKRASQPRAPVNTAASRPRAADK
jgi:dCMP deaminase